MTKTKFVSTEEFKRQWAEYLKQEPRAGMLAIHETLRTAKVGEGFSGWDFRR